MVKDEIWCFQANKKEMIHPNTELRYISEEVGYGVVATELIPAGTITWALDKLDREFSPVELTSMESLYKDILETYSFRNSQGNHVLCWDNGRYVNHSFNSNCLTTAYDFELAIRDIHPGEELTDDYGYLNIAEPFRGKNEGTRRKIVYPNDLQKYYRVWDKKLLKVFKNILKVKQPLMKLLSEQTRNEVEEICLGSIKMKSILTNYYSGDNSLAIQNDLENLSEIS